MIEIGDPFYVPIVNEVFLIAYSSENSNLVGYTSWDDEGVHQMIAVHPDYRRQGIATMLWKRARDHVPGLQISRDLTEAGKKWATSLGPEGTSAVAEGTIPVTVDRWTDLVTPEGNIIRFGETIMPPRGPRTPST
jgi:GNAT superfamily N-acetyltransferase